MPNPPILWGGSNTSQLLQENLNSVTGVPFAKGGTRTYYQVSQPSDWANGDLWIRSTDGRIFQRIAGVATHVGYFARQLGSGANFNLSLGENVSSGFVSGQNNVSMGVNTASNVTTGSFNTLIGAEAARGGNTSSSTIVGYNAGRNLRAGVNSSVGFGANAGFNGFGASDTFIGQGAGFYVNSSQTGNSNTAVGFEALGSGTLTSGNNNVAIGVGALTSLSSGSNNVAVGQTAGNQYQANTGTVSIGQRAASSVRTGNSHIAIGLNSFDGSSFPNSTGTVSIIAIGVNAISTGVPNSVQNDIAIGNTALRYNPSSPGSNGNNIGIGAFSCGGSPFSLTTAEYNVCLGSNSGFALSSGSNNVLIGYTAGNTLTTGTQNTLVGNGASVSAATNSSCIAIGAGATADNLEIRLGTTTQTNLRIPRYTAAGTLETDANGNITATSDARLKDHVAYIDNAREKLKHIKGALFKWKEETGKDSVGVYCGFYAQDVQKALPEAVQADHRDGMYSVQDRGVIALLVNAVNELSEEVESLKRRRK